MDTIKIALRTFVLATGVLLFAADLPAQTQGGETVGKPTLPDLRLGTIEGTEWSLYKNRGSVVVLNFWATWCMPCRTEIPSLVQIADEFAEAGVKVAGVTLDEGGTEIVREFAAEYKINYPILIPPPGSPLANTENVPITMLIDSEGRLAMKYTGAVPEDVLRGDIQKLLKKT